MSGRDYGPATWLRELARVQPPRWDWPRAIFVAASLAVPMGAGLALGVFQQSLFVALGALTTALGDGDGSYRSRLRQIVVSSLVGATGFFCGYLAALPYPVVILAMAALAFLAGIVNSYGAAWSMGTMQALLYASVAIGLPEIAPFWQPALLMLAGVALYAALLGAQALVDRRRPERTMLAGLVAALADLARARTGAGPDAEALTRARRAVTDRSHALYVTLLATRRGGRTHETLAQADFLDAADALFVALLGEGDAATLTATAGWLDALSAAIARQGPVPAAPQLPGPVGEAATAVAAAAASHAILPATATHHLPRPRLPRGELSLPHLAVGPAVLQRAAALSLCIAIAYASRYVLHEDHWYWVPMTVSIVMKPDFGSVFVRAVLRSAGTSLGVVVGVALLNVLPPGRDMIVALALIGAFLPLAKSLSYGVQMLALTPIVLILLELIAPTTGVVAYGEQRFVATLVGGLIVLVFGYFIWPRAHARELAQAFEAALGATADHLEAAFGAGPPDRARTLAAERAAYARLSDLRAALGRSMAEPPPAGREAAAWFPLVAAAERVNDRIAAATPRAAARPPAAEVDAVAQLLRGAVHRDRRTEASPVLTDPVLRTIAAEVAQLSDRLEGALPRDAVPA